MPELARLGMLKKYIKVFLSVLMTTIRVHIFILCENINVSIKLDEDIRGIDNIDVCVSLLF